MKHSDTDCLFAIIVVLAIAAIMLLVAGCAFGTPETRDEQRAREIRERGETTYIFRNGRWEVY